MQNSMAPAGTDNWNDTWLAQAVTVRRESTHTPLDPVASARDDGSEEPALARWLDDGGAPGIDVMVGATPAAPPWPAVPVYSHQETVT